MSLAAIDVLENTGRDLRLSRTEWEREGSSFDRFAEDDVVRDRELRRHAAEQQIPADESKITLDTVDPPAWGPAPPDATPLITRCHELRTKPLRDFTAEDLRIMIGQQVALSPWCCLRARPAAIGLAGRRRRLPHRPAGQRASRGHCVLGTVARFRLRATQTSCERPRTIQASPGLRELIETFNREHSARRIALRARLATIHATTGGAGPFSRRRSARVSLRSKSARPTPAIADERYATRIRPAARPPGRRFLRRPAQLGNGAVLAGGEQADPRGSDRRPVPLGRQPGCDDLTPAPRARPSKDRTFGSQFRAHDTAQFS